MANPITGMVKMSSAGNTAGIGLDPTAIRTTVMITINQTGGLAVSTSTGSAADFCLQGTFDGYGSATAYWVTISTIHWSSATPDGYMATITGPIAGLRLSSTTWTAGSAWLYTLQGPTAGL